MAVLAAILPTVGRSSRLALELYKLAATLQDKAAEDHVQAAKAISGFASILKQLGTIIKEDDRLPSHEAVEALEDVIDQSCDIFSRIETTASSNNNNKHYDDQRNITRSGFSQPGSAEATRLNYYRAHLEALTATLSAMLQTLYTAQTIMWSKLEPTVSPKNVEDAVASERFQLQSLIIEQQMKILCASRIHEKDAHTENRLLMEADSSRSLVLTSQEEPPRPVNLHRYQDKFISSLHISGSPESEWLPSLCSVAGPQTEILLDRWTSLPQFDDRIRDAERNALNQKRETQQPMVESDEEDSDQQQKLAGNGTRMAAPKSKSGHVQPLFMDAESAPVPARDTKYGPTAPLSPAASPRTSRDSVGAGVMDYDSPVSPRSSISSLPVEAAAAMEAKEEDDDIDLEIPWTLCTRKHYWRHVDSKLVSSNTEQLPAMAFLERGSWTEIMASWVCKEAIREAGYRVTQVQKDVRDGRRTKLETCFYVEQPLQFHQVKQLVERTVEIYRQKKPATPPPPPRVRRSSFQRPPPPPQNMAHAKGIDRDRTPVPQRPNQPPLERSTTAMLVPPMPPRLDRSLSTPGPGSGAVPIPGFQHAQNPRASNLQIPPLPTQYSSSLPHGPYSPSAAQAPYPQQLYNSPQAMYPPSGAFSSLPPPPLPPHMQSHSTGMPQSPLRQSYLHPHTRPRYEDEFTLTDSDSGERERRRQRSKSRSRYAADKKKKSHTKSKAAGALLGVGGLTALLDGLSTL